MDSGRPRQHRQGVFFTLLALLVPCFTSVNAWAAGPRVNFSIPAGDATNTVQSFLLQSNLVGLYGTEALTGITTNPVYGNFDAEEALTIMLKGTPLRFAIEGSSLTLELSKAQESGSAEPSGVAKATTLAQTAGPEEPEHFRDRPLAEPEQVVITGTLIRGVIDVMSPLEVIAKRDLSKTPYATVQDAVQALVSNSGSSIGEDSGASGNFLRGSTANLRGIGYGATLVLVNGRRQPYSGIQGDYVDLSNIPVGAVDRIEVLPDGASALYGSDAIAGVVNIIMKSDFQGGETQLRGGTAAGGASEKLFSQTFGTDWETGNFLASYQFLSRSDLAASDRVYSANSDKREFGGDDFRSFFSSPGNILDPRTGQPAYGITESGEIVAGAINLQNRIGHASLLPKRQSHNLYLSGAQQLGERVEFFGEARLGVRDVESNGISSGQVLQVPRSNPFLITPYPTAPTTFIAYNFINDLGPFHIDAGARSYTATAGATVDIGDSWKLTASVSSGAEKMDYRALNGADPGKVNAALADPDPATAFNPFGPTNPETLAGIRMDQAETARSALTSGNLVADGTLTSWYAGDIRLAVGGEWRKEQLLRTVLGARTGNFDREVESAFAELSVPLVGDPEQPRATPRLELSLASRYERYSDFGTTWNPKIGIRWAPWDSMKFRASWGTSFKAPQLFDRNYFRRNTATLAFAQDPKSPTRSTLALVAAGSNPDLSEETASTWTAGLDIVPSWLPDLQLSMTYYSIEYQDRIIVPGPSPSTRILLEEDVWQDVITRSPSPAQIAEICDSGFYDGDVAQCKSAPVGAVVDLRVRNLAATTVRGVDLKIDQVFRSSLGSFQLGLNGNYALDFQQQVTPRSPVVDVLDTVSNPVAFRARATADWYQRAWGRPGFGVNLTLDHIRGYQDVTATSVREVGGFNSVDVRLSYRTAPDGYLGDVEFALNGANVLDRSPPFINREQGYDLVNSDPYGRVISFSLQKTW
jgi:iron complex outermembrane recepter protein